ncbi:MAG: glycosyltransferase [Candidatus Lernaella stagnicola]|nr:glycosyltransferase [Candidatus Lernaella stagnicola]
MSEHLERNLTALQRHQGELVKRLLAAPRDPSYQLAQTSDGSLVVLRTGGAQPVALSQPKQAAALAAQFADQREALVAGKEPLCFSGLRAGYEVREMISRLRRTDYEAARGVYVFEESFDIFRLALAAHDWRELIEAGNLFFFVGPDAPARAVTFFTEDLGKPPPQQVVPLGSQEQARRVLAVLQTIVQELSNRVGEWKRQIQAYLDELTPEKLAQVYFTPEKLRFILVSNKLSYFVQHSIRDLRRALETMGASVLVLEEQSVVDRMTGPLQLRALAEFQPHGVMMIDHTRHESPGLYPAALPFFAFLQDYMQDLMTPEAAAQAVPRDLFVGCVANLVRHEKRQCVLLPAWSSPETYAPESDEEGRDFACDVCFVSNLSQSHEAAYTSLRGKWIALEPRLGPVIDRIYARALELDRDGRMFADSFAFRQWTEKILAEAGVTLARPLVFTIDVYDRLINLMLRHQPLEWAAAAGYKLALYGRGWEKHPRLARFAKGVADNGPELAAIYRAAPIHLHVNQYNLEHPRIVDGLLAGAFFLVRETRSLGLLELDECFFATREQLLEKIAAFRDRPETRREVVARNRQRIRRWATYEKGLRVSFTHFALLRLMETIRDETLPSAATENATAKLVERFALDPVRFGLHVLIESAIAAGHLPEGAGDALESWDEYGRQWGSDAWEDLLAPGDVEKLAANLGKALAAKPETAAVVHELLLAWRQRDTAYELAHRLALAGLTPPAGHTDEAAQLRAEHACSLPLLRHRLHEDDIDARCRLRGAHTKRWSHEDHIAFTDAAELGRLRYPMAAGQALEKAVQRVAAQNPWPVIAAASHAILSGDLDHAEALLTRFVSESAPPAELRYAQVLRAWSQSSRGDIEGALGGLPELGPDSSAWQVAATLRARGHAAAREWKSVVEWTAHEAAFDNPRLHEAATGYRALAEAALENGATWRKWNGEARFTVEQIPLPSLPRGVMRVRQLVTCGDYLAFSCPAAPAGLAFFDPATRRWELPDAAATSSWHPEFALASTGSQAVAASWSSREVIVLDREGGAAEHWSLPEGFGVAANFAVSPAGAVVIADSFHGCLWHRSPEGDWRRLSHPVSSAESALIRWTGEDFLLATGDEVVRVTEAGEAGQAGKLVGPVLDVAPGQDGLLCLHAGPYRIAQYDSAGRPTWEAAVFGDFVPWHLAGVAALGGTIYTADDRHGCLLGLRVKE